MNARIDTSTLSHLSNRHLDALEEERKLLYWVRRIRNDHAIAKIRAGSEELAEELAVRERWADAG